MSTELRQRKNALAHLRPKRAMKPPKVSLLWKLSSTSRLLRELSKENAFYFFSSIGNYTGESAASLEEFLEKIREIDISSLEFHFSRRDFRKWIAEALEDRELATEIEHLQNLEPTGDTLRNPLVFTVSKRYENLLKLSR